jgi:hypothetical protein
MFSKLEGCVAKVATRQKKVVHGHSCEIFAHDLSPDREIMDKGGCCNLQCSGLKKIDSLTLLLYNLKLGLNHA